MHNLEQRSTARARNSFAGFGSTDTAAFLEQRAMQAEINSGPRGLMPRAPERAAEEPAYEYREVEPASGPMTFERACRILGVNTSANRRQIKAAYRRMVTLWHPDRMRWSTAEARRRANEQMALINDAYRLLRTSW